MDTPSNETPPVPSRDGERRNSLIDLLRGVAILLVVVAHYGLLHRYVVPEHTHWFGREVGVIEQGAGYYGVCLFFVVSGFLITSLSLRRYGQLNRISCRAFWWMRFCRIMPMLLLAMGCLLLFHALRVPGYVFTSWASAWETVRSILSFRFYEIFNRDPGMMPWNPLWSLSVEEAFYLAFPLICLILNGPAAVACVAALVISSSLILRISGNATNYSTLGCMDLLALGAVTALLRPDRLGTRLAPALRRMLVALLVCGAAVNLAYWILRRGPTSPGHFAPFLCGFSSVAILVVSQIAEPGRTLGSLLAPVVALGSMSYELYLLHLPVLVVLASRRWAPSVGWAWFAAAAVAAAWMAQRLYSDPLNRNLRMIGSGTGSDRARAWEAVGRALAIGVAVVVAIGIYAMPGR